MAVQFEFEHFGCVLYSIPLVKYIAKPDDFQFRKSSVLSFNGFRFYWFPILLDGANVISFPLQNSLKTTVFIKLV